MRKRVSRSLPTRDGSLPRQSGQHALAALLLTFRWLTRQAAARRREPGLLRLALPPFVATAPARWLVLLALLACCPRDTAWAQTSGQATPASASVEAEVAGESQSGGAATEGVSRSALQWLRDGGPMMVPIVICSLTLCIYVLERAFVLRHDRVIPGPFVHRLIDQIVEGELKADDALALCVENGSPMSEVFAAAIKKWGRPSVEVEQAVLDSGERVASRLRKNLRVFHGVSTVGPLLGLLGTVFGMIESFTAVASSDAMGRPELLAAGISEALITTAGGLSVAIPAILAHLFFVGRVDGMVSEIDRLGQEMVNAIASDGWREKREKKPVKAAKPKAA